MVFWIGVSWLLAFFAAARVEVLLVGAAGLAGAAVPVGRVRADAAAIGRAGEGLTLDGAETIEELHIFFVKIFFSFDFLVILL